MLVHVHRRLRLLLGVRCKSPVEALLLFEFFNIVDFVSTRRTDTACLCSHPAFADATRQCAGSACSIEDSSSVNGVLNNMCRTSISCFFSPFFFF